MRFLLDTLPDLSLAPELQKIYYINVHLVIKRGSGHPLFMEVYRWENSRMKWVMLHCHGVGAQPSSEHGVSTTI